MSSMVCGAGRAMLGRGACFLKSTQGPLEQRNFSRAAPRRLCLFSAFCTAVSHQAWGFFLLQHFVSFSLFPGSRPLDGPLSPVWLETFLLRRRGNGNGLTHVGELPLG
eukprot:RCo039159